MFCRPSPLGPTGITSRFSSPICLRSARTSSPGATTRPVQLGLRFRNHRKPSSRSPSGRADAQWLLLGGSCLSVDLEQVGGDQPPVGRLSLVGEILPTGYRTTTYI